MISFLALNNKLPYGNIQIQTNEQLPEENLVESEFFRALNLKSNGKVKSARHIFRRLINTYAFKAIASTTVNEQLMMVVFECFKNLAEIEQENGRLDSALFCYVMASRVDNHDTNLLLSMGNLALNLEKFELAEFAFRSCLTLNKTHWIADRGKSQVYWQDRSQFPTLGVARHITNLSKLPTRTSELCSEILSFPSFIWPLPAAHILNNCIERQYLNFTGKFILKKRKDFNFNAEDEQLKTLQFSLQGGTETLNAFGHYINNILQESPVCNGELLMMTFKMVTEHLFRHASSGSVFETQLTEDKNANADHDFEKPKAKRRCSDLKLLEQWGWHKNKKYSRKKNQPGSSDNTDDTLCGILKEIFCKYFTFSNSVERREKSTISSEEDVRCQICHTSKSNELVEKDEKFVISSLFERSMPLFVDVQQMSYMWMEKMSNFWDKKLTDEFGVLYISIFENYISKFGFLSLTQLNTSSFEPTFRICLQYLELFAARSISENRSLPDIWVTVLQFLMSNVVFIFSECRASYESIYIRLLNAKFLYHNIHNEIESSICSLKTMEAFLSDKAETFKIHLPNLNTFCISRQTTRIMRCELEKRARLKAIPQLYAKKQWSDICFLVIEHISTSWYLNTCPDWLSDFKQLNELLLYSLWQANLFQECVINAEKYLHYLLDNCRNKTSCGVISRVLSLNYTLSYIEASTLLEKCNIVKTLKQRLPRLVRNLVTLLSYCFEEDTHRKAYVDNEFNIGSVWIILHQILIRDENIEVKDIMADHEMDRLPKPFLLLSTGHEYNGRQQICTKDSGRFLRYSLDFVMRNIKSPLYESSKSLIIQFLEQITYCLFGFPSRRLRVRHLDEHNAENIDLAWQTAVDLFEVYSPERLPEFNSYKSESISSDMEQFALRILSLFPNRKPYEILFSTITNSCASGLCHVPVAKSGLTIPQKLKNIYYLLADYYFKSGDFRKAIVYYMLDISFNSSRFDSWVSLSLSKASCIETQLNDLSPIDFLQILKDADDVIKCFSKAISILKNHTLLWIEYGSFVYTISSFCARNIKDGQENNSSWRFILEKKKEAMLNTAHNCFSLSATLQHGDACYSECSEDRWLCQYMLGKISEKRKEHPNAYLKYYLMAFQILFESNPIYPIKINHSSPTFLAVEIHELFYRINASILKYIQANLEIRQDHVNLFKCALKKISSDAFIRNESVAEDVLTSEHKKYNYNQMVMDNAESANSAISCIKPPVFLGQPGTFCSSKEGAALNSSYVENFNLPSSSALEKHTNCTKNAISFETDKICTEIVINLEKCAYRFAEHFKSIYRLAHFYLYGPHNFQSLNKCEELLLGQYKTVTGETINGIFFERKQTNLFNGIWRVPSSEIDRPGNFSAHIIKCAKLLIDLLRRKKDYSTLTAVIFQLYKTPDADKRYMLDEVRFGLCNLAMRYCNDIIRAILKSKLEHNNNEHLLDLLIEIFKIQKKSSKHMPQNDKWLSEIFVEIYYHLIKGDLEKSRPDINAMESATKLCLCEINQRKANLKM